MNFNLAAHVAESIRATNCAWCLLTPWRAPGTSDMHLGPQTFYAHVFRKWHHRAERLAYDHDARYREIEDIRNANSSPGSQLFLSSEHGLGLPEWDYQMSTEEKVKPRPRWLRALGYVEHNRLWPDDLWRRTRVRWLRSKHGWSYEDVWSFDSHLSKVITEGVANLRETTCGWPGDVDGLTSFEDWLDVLDRIVLGFRAGEALKWDEVTDAERAEKERLFDEGFELLHKWYHHLWS